MLDFDRTYTVKEVASVLGVCYSTAYELTRTSPDYGGLPSYKFGGRIKVKESDLQKWIDARKRA